MFISDVCVQIARVSKAGRDLLLTQLALGLVKVLGFSVGTCLESEITPNRRFGVLFLNQASGSGHFPSESFDRLAG